MIDSRLPGSRRLKARREFDAVFKSADQRISSPEFLVLTCRNRLAYSRIGTVVSKRVAKSAVNRNRIRRLIKESFRRRFDKSGYDVVVIAREGAGQSENARIHEILGRLLRKVDGST